MHRFNPNVLLKKTYWYTLNDCLEHWLVNALGLLIGPCADWSRKFISNPDWQLCYVKRTLSPLFGFASEIGVRFRGSLCVSSGSAWGLLCVRSGSSRGQLWVRFTPIGPRTRTQGSLWVRFLFCPDGTVFIWVIFSKLLNWTGNTLYHLLKTAISQTILCL